MTFKKLAQAFTILAKYSEDDYMIQGEHDILHIHIDPANVSSEDKAALEELGVHADTEDLQNFYIWT